MSDVARLIARLQLLAQIEAKLNLVEQLRARCNQKIAEILQRQSEAKTVEILDANAKKLETLGKQLSEAEPAFTELSARFKKASSNVESNNFDRIAPRVLRSLERLQSVFETELIELDDLVSQLEDRSSS